MLRGLEIGLKELWNHLLQDASTLLFNYGEGPLARFSNPANIAAEISMFCKQHQLGLTGNIVSSFLQRINDLPDKTYTGKFAQIILNCLLQIAKYLNSEQLNPQSFLADMAEILKPYELQVHAHLDPVNRMYIMIRKEVREEADKLREFYNRKLH